MLQNYVDMNLKIVKVKIQADLSLIANKQSQIARGD